MRRFESKQWGWWYLAIGIGYVLLAVVYLLRDAGLKAVALRLAIAVGNLPKVSGAHGGGVPPVPIPNTAVKPASADDSRAAGPLESRTVPD